MLETNSSCPTGIIESLGNLSLPSFALEGHQLMAAGLRENHGHLKALNAHADKDACLVLSQVQRGGWETVARRVAYLGKRGVVGNLGSRLGMSWKGP